MKKLREAIEELKLEKVTIVRRTKRGMFDYEDSDLNYVEDVLYLDAPVWLIEDYQMNNYTVKAVEIDEFNRTVLYV